MKLALIYRSILEKREDGYYIKDVMGNYLEKIAPLFSQINICASVYPQRPQKRSFSHYKLQISNVRVFDRGKEGNEFSIVSKLFYYFKLFKLFYTQVRKWDALYIFLPSYAGMIASVTSRMFGKPYFVYIGADWKASSKYVWRWGGIKRKILFPVYLILNEYIEKMVIKHSKFTLVHGDALQKKYKSLKDKVIKTVPIINLTNKDIYLKKYSFISNNKIRCLFVGALIPRKGLSYLLQAIRMLKDKKYNLVLNLVGASDEKYEKKLRKLIKELNLDNDITFAGYIPNGSKLLEIYRNSDIFVLPTLNEGFPRVLYEAMSQSLPIVTTEVGGIPGLMTHEVNALLVPPKNPKALANAIERVIKNETLRQRLIANGTRNVSEILKKDAAEQLKSLLIKFIPSF